MKWTIDAFAESRINGMDIPITRGEISPDAIDWDDSSQNGARLGESIKEAVVSDYALAMERGDVFPMIVVLKRRGKKYMIISGNHRALAVKSINPKAKIPAYIIETTDQLVIDMLPRILNRGHGVHQDREEAISHAIYAVQKYGLTQANAEKMFGLRPATLAPEIRIRALRDKLETKGVDTRKLSKFALIELAKLHNDNVLLQASVFAIRNNIPAYAVEELSRKIRQKGTESSQLEVIRSYSLRTFGKDLPKASGMKTSRGRFLAALSMLENNLNGHETLAQYQITEPEEIERTKTVISTVVNRLCKISGVKVGKKATA